MSWHVTWAKGAPMAAVLVKSRFGLWRARRSIRRAGGEPVAIPVNAITMAGLAPWQAAAMWEEWSADHAAFYRDAATVAQTDAG